MASLAASTAASLGVSEMLGNPLSFSAASARSTPSPSPATFKPVAIFGKKPAPKSKPSTVSPINDELAKWYGESQPSYQAFELIHARWAMLGAAGFIIPEAFNKFGANCGPEAVWFKVGLIVFIYT
ncbi:Chlorophyll a-b binding protein CP26, chloroplastic, partial [Cucurbita argyrosperma subsp. argyrosperma]